MKRAILIALLGLGTMAPWMLAQNNSSVPKWQVGVGYEYIHANQPPGQCSCFSLNGGVASAAYTLNPKFSLVGEFLGATNGNISNSGRNLNLFGYLFGPRYTYRHGDSKVMPFGQVLIGGAHASGSLYSPANGYSGSSNGFAMTAGGGLDIGVSEHVALRVFQADYLLTKLANHANDAQNNFSFSAGVVFNFGSH